MIIGNIKRQWLWCIVCRCWKRSDYYTIKGQCNRICEACMPDDQQPEPKFVELTETA